MHVYIFSYKNILLKDSKNIKRSPKKWHAPFHPLIRRQSDTSPLVTFIRLTGPVFFSLPLGTVPGACAWWRWWVLPLWRDHSAGELLLRSQRKFHVHSFFDPFFPSLWSFSIFIFLLCVLCWHPHLSYLLCKNHSCHCKLLFVLLRDENKWIELNWIELDWIELNWIELNWIELNWIEVKWMKWMNMMSINIHTSDNCFYPMNFMAGTCKESPFLHLWALRL